MMKKKFKSADVNVLAIIPARGGSKRIPQKNIRILAGKPLIAHTIQTAKNSKYINRVMVSTNDQEITDISKKYGAEIIRQPNYLSKNNIRTAKVIIHILSKLKKEHYTPEIIVLLQPTSPLRTNVDIDNAIKIFLQNHCESVVSVSKIDSHFHWALKIKNNYLNPIFGWGNFKIKSHNLPTVYKPTGAIFVFSYKFIFKTQSFYNQKTMPYIMPKERSIDIDEEIDFKLTEQLLKNDRVKQK